MKVYFKTLLLLAAIAFFMLGALSCGDDDDDDDSGSDESPDDDDDDDNDDDDDDDNDDDNDDDDDTTPTDPNAGVYDVTGTDDDLGAYTGQVELIATAQRGAYIFYRLVQYADFSFGDYDTIQTAWEGTATIAGTDLTAYVTLQRSEFILEYDGDTRGEDEKYPLAVTGDFTLSEGTFTGTYTSYEDIIGVAETMTRAADNGPEPIWKNEDEMYESHSEPPAFLKNLIDLLLTDYHDLEFYDDYRDREEFKRYVHYMPHFRGDFDFFRENQSGLRVANKVVDKISLMETQSRAEAFKYTLAEKAAFFDEDTPAHTINEYGMVARYIIGTDPPEYRNDYDSMLWTGTYVASQAYRYMATQEPVALDNMLFSLEGLIKCVEITGDPTTFARTLRTTGSEADDLDWADWNEGAGEFTGIQWRCCGNNDMIQGIFYGYAAALLALPEDSAYDDLLQRMADTAVSLNENSEVVSGSAFNPILMNLLCYLLTDDAAYYTAYQQAFNVALQAWIFAGNGLVYVYGVSDWSGQHLNTVGMQALYLMALLADDPKLPLIKQGFINGMALTKVSRQALFAMSAYAFAQPGAAHQESLEDAIWTMREMPYPKRPLVTDMRVNDHWCASPLPSLFWKFNWATGGRHQGLYGTPVFMRASASCVYTCNPFSISWGPSDTYDNGADFLHIYWLGKLYGVIDGDE